MCLWLAGCYVVSHDVTLDSVSSSTELTLDNAPTVISEDVPEFFKRYFRNVAIDFEDHHDGPLFYRVLCIRTRGLPPHKSYYYGEDHPNFEEFPGNLEMAAPNLIAEQDVTFQLPIIFASDGTAITLPESSVIDSSTVDGTSGDADEYPLGPAGVAIDGVLLFAGFADPPDELRDEIPTFDSYHAHPDCVDPSDPAMCGRYHYHEVTAGPLEVLESEGYVTDTTPGMGEIEVYGIMIDGTVVLGCVELDGSSYDTAGLDTQGGHVHDIIASDGTAMFENHYHIHMCPKAGQRRYTPEVRYYRAGTVTSVAP